MREARYKRDGFHSLKAKIHSMTRFRRGTKAVIVHQPEKLAFLRILETEIAVITIDAIQKRTTSQ